MSDYGGIRELRRVQKSTNLKVFVALLIGMGGGYFAGREHVKYELRSAMKESVQAVKQTFGRTPAISRTQNVELAKPSVPLKIGQGVNTGQGSIACVQAAIGRVDHDTMLGKTITTDDEYLIITFDVQNGDGRRQMFTSLRTDLSPTISVVDDVDNSVRAFYGNDEIAGQPSFTIDPESSSRFQFAFQKPLPKTKYVVAIVELDVIGGEGRARFEIPVESITGWNVPPATATPEPSSTQP